MSSVALPKVGGLTRARPAKTGLSAATALVATAADRKKLAQANFRGFAMPHVK